MGTQVPQRVLIQHREGAHQSPGRQQCEQGVPLCYCMSLRATCASEPGALCNKGLMVKVRRQVLFGNPRLFTVCMVGTASSVSQGAKMGPRMQGYTAGKMGGPEGQGAIGMGEMVQRGGQEQGGLMGSQGWVLQQK